MKVLLSAALSYWEVFLKAFSSFSDYVWQEITFQVDPWYYNYFYWLIALSLVVWVLEILFPWRKDQPTFRKDFWLDFFYMFFNFYIFKIVIFFAVSVLLETIFIDVIGGDVSNLAIVDLGNLPSWVQLIIFFVATDFVQWLTHVMLHRFQFLWNFHKVHHSVTEMGFAAHLRYHWMENVIYTPFKYLMVMLIGGFSIAQTDVVFYLAITIGHLNHANLNLSYGPLKYIFNNPKMHIWHHAYSLPDNRKHGVNFGISLSIWDYIFRTAYIPSNGAHIPLGFEGVHNFPSTFWQQLTYGFVKEKKQSDKESKESL